jgi:hypothetical protein
MCRQVKLDKSAYLVLVLSAALLVSAFGSMEAFAFHAGDHDSSDQTEQRIEDVIEGTTKRRESSKAIVLEKWGSSDKANSDFDYIRQGEPVSYPYPGTRTATAPNGTKLSRYRSSNDEPTLSIDSPNRDKVIKVRY